MCVHLYVLAAPRSLWDLCSSTRDGTKWKRAVLTTGLPGKYLHISFGVIIFLRYMPRSVIAGSYGNSIFSLVFFCLKETPYCFPLWLYQFIFQPIAYEGSLFSKPLSAFIICRLFDNGPSDCCEVIPLCNSDLHFSNNQQS